MSLSLSPTIPSNSYPENILETPQEEINDSWFFIEEDPLSVTKKIFSQKAEQLHLNPDPILDLIKEMHSLIHYEGSDYKILYVADDRLEYYIPRFPYGSYANGDDVIDYIEKKLKRIYNCYHDQPRDSRWRILKIARTVQESLEKILKNYSHKSYQDFSTKLLEKKTALETFITEKTLKLNKCVEDRIEVHENGTLFQLLNCYADSYPKNLILNLIEKNYGSRLKNVVLHLFPCEEDRIFHDIAYKFLFVIATCVNREDLHWKYSQMTQNRINPTPFENLSDKKIEQLLNLFRKAPDQSNLLDYFHIKISLDKFIVEESYIKLNSARTIYEQNLLNEIQIYADIESVALWDKTPHIQMSQLQMYDQLETLLKNPYKSQLFHSDRYISFLTTAATIIAYANTVQSDSEVLNERLTLIIRTLEDIVDHADIMYPNEYIEQYKVHWNTLIGKLNDSINSGKIDFSDYYLQLFAHPLLDDKRKIETLECFHSLQPYEYLARKVAYWNCYYLCNPFHVNEKGELIDSNAFSHRIGTLFYCFQNNKKILFEIDKIIQREGLVCQIATPVNISDSNAEPTPIKILFQGTIENSLSIKRDACLKGAGYTLWYAEKKNLVLPELYETIKEIYSKTKIGVNLYFIGHSLGGSEVQNAISFLAENLLQRKFDATIINEINVHTFNSAGIPKESIHRFNLSIKNFISKIGKISHTVVKNDLVSKTNEGKIGAEFPEQDKVIIMEISNYGVFHLLINHCDYVHSWTNNILPHKLLKSPEEGRSRHHYLYGITHSLPDFLNHSYQFIQSNPVLQVASGAIIVIIASAFQCQALPLARRLFLIGGTLSQPGVSMAHNAAEDYSKKQMTEAVSNIQEGIFRKWYGTQILEGTG